MYISFTGLVQILTGHLKIFARHVHFQIHLPDGHINQMLNVKPWGPVNTSQIQGWGEYYSGTRLAQNDKHEYTKNIVLEYYSSTDFPVLVLVCWVLAPALHRSAVGSRISWWRHEIETSVPVNSPHKGQWCGALMFSLIYAWINDWVNSREAGDLRCHHGHYDVTVMSDKLGEKNVW